MSGVRLWLCMHACSSAAAGHARACVDHLLLCTAHTCARGNHAHPACPLPCAPPLTPCSGQLQLRFVWEVTARSLLTIKLHALERVLDQRREILAALQPVLPETATPADAAPVQ